MNRFANQRFSMSSIDILNGSETADEVIVNDETTNNGKVDKIDKYKWTTVDKPGAFAMLGKDQLHVDPTYQRTANERKIQMIASRWSWIACGVIVVAKRGGRYYVMDGGHRTIAARKRSDIRQLPCIVFVADSVQVEAQGFLDANTLRKPVAASDKFRAMTITGDEHALAVKAIVEDSGYAIDMTKSSGRIVKCIALLMKLYRSDEEVFRGIWPLIVDACHGGIVQERVVDSLFWIENKLKPTGISLNHRPWRERVVRLGAEGIHEAAARASAYYKRGGAAIWGQGVLDALNRGVRNRLEIGEGIGQ